MTQSSSPFVGKETRDSAERDWYVGKQLGHHPYQGWKHPYTVGSGSILVMMVGEIAPFFLFAQEVLKFGSSKHLGRNEG